jgi:cell filamentation protein
MKNPVNDPYCYPGTSILINKYAVKNQRELDKIEANLTVARIKQLAMMPLRGEYGLDHFCAIHKFIFQDLFDWAGVPRTVNIFKNEYQVLAGRSVVYCDYKYITDQATNRLEALKSESWDKMSIENRAKIFAGHMASLWKIHCFREGNTRTVAQFCGQFANDHDMPLDHSLFEKHSLYFRNALVAANAIFDDLGDRSQPEYLYKIVFDAIAHGKRKVK